MRKLNNFLPLPDGRYLATGAGRTQARSREILAPRCRTPARIRAPPRSDRRRAARARARTAAERDRRRLAEGPAGADARGPARQTARGDSTRRCAPTCWICSRFRPPNISIASSKASRSRPCSASTASSATTPARTRRARAYVLLHHVFGEVNGVKGAWGHAIGGMGAITQAMAKAADRGRRRDPHRRGRARSHRRGTAARSASSAERAISCMRARSSPTSIRNCFTSG